MYKGGGFYFPTSAGSFSVTDLGFRPQGVFFFGGNEEDEDVVMLTDNPGLFFGSAWIDIDTGLMDQQSNFIGAPDNWHFVASAISTAKVSGSSTHYQADLVSFDDNGFTLNVTSPAPGPRPIHWLAYGDFDGAQGRQLVSFDSNTFTYENIGYRPTTGLMWHFWPLGGGRDIQSDGGNFFSMATGNWAKIWDGTTYGITTRAGAITFRTYTSLGSAGYTNAFFSPFQPTSMTPTIRPFVAGSFLDAFDHMEPYSGYPSGAAEGISVSVNGFTTRHSIQWWTGEGNVQGVQCPDLGVTDTYSVTSNVPEIQAVLFYGLAGSGYGSGSILGPPQTYVVGMLTPDYQGVVVYDGNAQSAFSQPAFFQSRQYCFAENIQYGVRAASGEIVDDQVFLTGEIEDSASIATNSFMQSWGDTLDVFIPNIYRRVFR